MMGASVRQGKGRIMGVQFQSVLICVGMLLGAQSAQAQTTAPNTPMTTVVNKDQPANQALNSSPSATIAKFRDQGPAGLRQFLANHGQELQSAELPTPELRSQLDALCQQRDCHASRLYWHTDLAKAQAAAQASNKPILSLRLLGNLEDELSCANSRFFRVALYPNAQVSKYLRDRFVLHWESVRPAPVMTIDFGDGRKLKRTVTGNSIHYILDAEGRPLEALPGLYGPQAFLQHLQRGEELWQQTAKLKASERQEHLRHYHRQRLREIQKNWTQDLQKAGVPNLPALAALPSNTPSAVDAAPIAVGKAMVEIPLVSSTLSLSTLVNRNRTQLDEATQPQTWGKIAQSHANQARLDNHSKVLMLSKNNAYQAKSSFAKTIENFERAMAIDTVRNEYLLHSQLHQWFVEEAQTRDITTLNEKVYAQLFLTPDSDPWLGLVPTDIYSAIEGDGIQLQ